MAPGTRNTRKKRSASLPLLAVMVAKIAGSRKFRNSPPSANRIVSGWKRRSDGISAITRQKLISKGKRVFPAQPRQRHHGVLGAGGVDNECAETVTTFDGSLRDVGVLYTGAGHVHNAPPDHAAPDFQPVGVKPIRRVLVGFGGPRP